MRGRLRGWDWKPPPPPRPEPGPRGQLGRSGHSPAPLSQDFETNKELKSKVVGFLEEVTRNPELLTQERKAAANIVRTLTQEDPGDNQITLEEITQLAAGVKAEPFESHSALEIAEQLTLLDHLVFKKIPYEEFFGQGWMKLEKNERTPYIMKTTKHFNDISNLIASEIIRNEDISARVSAIEKWVAVADICRCLHNYNAVLEITSSMNRSAIFRLKKTWLKVSKQTKALIDKLQKLVSSDGRFKNLREALKKPRCPSVPPAVCPPPGLPEPRGLCLWGAPLRAFTTRASVRPPARPRCLHPPPSHGFSAAASASAARGPHSVCVPTSPPLPQGPGPCKCLSPRLSLPRGPTGTWDGRPDLCADGRSLPGHAPRPAEGAEAGAT